MATWNQIEIQDNAFHSSGTNDNFLNLLKERDQEYNLREIHEQSQRTSWQ